MNNKRIEEMIQTAMLELPKSGILTSDKKLPSNYSGYIDSYGPTIRQSGLMQAVIFYQKEKREKINSLIKLLLEKKGHLVIGSGESLTDIVKATLNNHEEKAKLQRLILEAIVACKYAMRTFTKVIEKEND